jgi:outer membrane lipoprotein carrier protein
MKPVAHSVLFFIVLVITTPVMAASGEQQLQAFYRDVHSMRADFTQAVVSENSARVDKSKGVLQMKRPGKFRWDYSEPYEQQIIANGKTLWIYDVDMEQVIEKPLGKVLGQTPAILLSGNAPLADRFTISDVHAPELDNTLAWVKLVPKQDDVGFQVLLLGFKDNSLREMQLVDAFGQMTRLVFSNLQVNPQIDDKVFNFVPPAGVDVIGDVKQP